jgi:phosphoribosyl-ATP pyrophosphohydrolase
MSYELTQEKLTKANKLLLKDIHQSLGIDKSVLSNNQLLQKISQAFFSKPYEEAKETILTNNKNNTEQSVAKVFLLHYSSEIVLTLNGQFYSATHTNLDNEITIEEIQRQAKELAKNHNSFVDNAYLPEIISEDDSFDYADIVLLAESMGNFKYEQTLFDLIENEASKIFIDGEHSHYKLDSEWQTEIVSECEDNDFEEYLIWHPEVGDNKSHNFKEFYFSFKNIAQAIKKEDNSWIIRENNGAITAQYIITFCF